MYIYIYMLVYLVFSKHEEIGKTYRNITSSNGSLGNFDTGSEKWNCDDMTIFTYENSVPLTRVAYILISHNMMILYFYLPYFHVSYSTSFLIKYSGTLLLHRRSLLHFLVKTHYLE